VSCDKCRMLKEMGAPRPDCPACGRPDLFPENEPAWRLVMDYREALFAPGGAGGFRVNPAGLSLVARLSGMVDEETLLRGALIMGREIFYPFRSGGDSDE